MRGPSRLNGPRYVARRSGLWLVYAWLVVLDALDDWRFRRQAKRVAAGLAAHPLTYAQSPYRERETA